MMLLSVLIAASTMISTQSASVGCCRLNVSTQDVVPTELTVTVTNLREPQVHVARTSAERDLRIQILDEDRRNPELTDYAKRLFRNAPGGSLADIVLKEGESMTQVLDLSKLYVLKTGSYSVTVYRDVFIAGRNVELQGKVTVRIP